MNQFNPEKYELDKEASTAEKLVYNKKQKCDYKVGDKVIITGNINSHGFNIGDEVKIIELNELYCMCHDGNIWWYVRYSDIKPAPKHEYKVGDKVIAVKDGGYSGVISPGDELKVVSVHENRCKCRVEDGLVWNFYFHEIKPAPKPEYNSYEDITNVVFKDGMWFTNSAGDIKFAFPGGGEFNPNNAITSYQLEHMLERNKLKTVANFLNGDWEPKFDGSIAYILIEKEGEVDIRKAILVNNLGVIYFKSKQIANEAFRILGEESILKALKA